jgi:hypothetical protein
MILPGNILEYEKIGILLGKAKHYKSWREKSFGRVRRRRSFFLATGAKLLQHCRGLSISWIEAMSALQHRQRRLVFA